MSQTTSIEGTSRHGQLQRATTSKNKKKIALWPTSLREGSRAVEGAGHSGIAKHNNTTPMWQQQDNNKRRSRQRRRGALLSRWCGGGCVGWWLALKSHPRHISRDIVSRDVEGTGKTRATRTACAPIAARHGPRSCSCGVVRCGVCVCAAGTEEQRRSKIGTHRALMCREERGRRAWRRIIVSDG